MALNSSAEQKDILVVDDSKSMRLFISGTLIEAGYTCDQAEDGNSGILQALRNRYRLILTDHDMPGVGGIGLVSRLRATERTRELPIIMITARRELEVVQQAVGVGVSGYLVKPFQPNDLLAKVQEFVAPRT